MVMTRNLQDALTSGQHPIFAEKVFNGAEGSWTPGNLPTGYRGVQVEFIGRSLIAAVNGLLGVRPNGDNGNNYSTQRVAGNAAAASAENQAGAALQFTIPGAQATADMPGQVLMTMLNHEGTDFFKVVTGNSVIFTNAGTPIYAACNAGVWRSKAAVTSLTIFESPNSNNFVAGSIARIRMIR